MRWLESKVPPVAVLGLVAVLMWWISRVSPEVGLPLEARYSIAIALAVAGLLLLSISVALFGRKETTVNPLTPEAASTLVTNGIYRWTRNPMYLGCLTLLLGWGVFLDSLIAFAAAFTFVAYMNRFQIGPEERALETRFSDEYEEYKRHVRRWL